MMTWLANDLAATTNLWIIAFWHHPPYSKGGHDSDIDQRETDMRENAVPILEAYGADLVLCGHSHSYERSMLIDGHYGTSDTFLPSMIRNGGNGREDGDGPYRKTAIPHDGAVYTVAGTGGSVSGGTFDHPVMITNFVVLGSVILDVNGNRLDAKFIDNTATIRDYFTIIKRPSNLLPVVTFTSPNNQFTTTSRKLDVTGQVDSGNPVVSVVVTNNRAGSVSATLSDGTNWTASGVELKLGTNVLTAIATDNMGAHGNGVISVVRASTNAVNTTLRTIKATYTRGIGPNADRVSLSGAFNDAGFTFDPTNETAQVVFGDYQAVVPTNALLKLKFKGKQSITNTLTSLSLSFKKHSFSFSASGFTLTNADPFDVHLLLGTNDLGPDMLTFPAPAVTIGKFSWSSKNELPDEDLFFLGKSKLSADSFVLTGVINVNNTPNLLADVLEFGIGTYDETLPLNGWSKGTGNDYSYSRPLGHVGVMETMEFDFDRGTWQARGSGANLTSLLADPNTDIRLEIADFAATFRARLVLKGNGLKY
jgi:hypothetical protein